MREQAQRCERPTGHAPAARRSRLSAGQHFARQVLPEQQLRQQQCDMPAGDHGKTLKQITKRYLILNFYIA
ncbi:hypothetical protein ACE0DR_20650 [Azotobacter sp. CWF10]